MTITDSDFHPEATGKAADVVKAHSKEVKDDEIKFYCALFSPFAQRAWIALEEKQIPYQYIEINPYSNDKSYLKINKRGMVPAIQCNGVSLSESEILLEYLDDAFPDLKKLFSTNPEQRALTTVE